ncbi:MAG: hypothetical protein D6819_09210 [Gammaproteobacteria bacterium]|nr:MAG: hypothetical protein D6819_09210 [Gammaproteobacteria bacterium]
MKAMRKVILPFEGTSPGDILHLLEDLAQLRLAFQAGGPVPVPPQAFDPLRRQYRAEVLLSRVRAVPGEKAIGIADVDLYAGGLNFVFGLAEMPGKAAVVSLYRLRFGADEGLFRERAVKETVHEFGHTLGLPHCPHPRCVMHFSNTLEEVDSKGKTFCLSCQQKLPPGVFG